MPRKNFSAATIKRRLDHAGRQCEAILAGGTRCPTPALPGRFQCDHNNPDGLTGEPTFENARILCTACHLEKTKRDVTNIAKAKRRESKHLGVDKAIAPAKPLQGAPMPTTAKAAARAARGTKPSLPPRSMFEDAR